MNEGLVQAFSSVGQNLFGSAVFNAAVPPNPIIPNDPVRLFVADSSQLPLAFNVFVPPNPIVPTELCRSHVQVSIDPTAGVVVKVDEDAAPANFNTETNVQFMSLANEPNPGTSQCPEISLGD